MFVIGIVVAALLGIFFVCLSRAEKLFVTYYTIDDSSFLFPLTIVQLSDLHCKGFDEENEFLIEAVRSAGPDLIVLTGDIINQDSSSEDIQKVLQLTASLVELAPVCYSLGNHEVSYLDLHGDRFLTDLEMTGVIVLEREYVERNLNGQTIRIGGIYGYVLSEELVNGPEQAFMEDFTDTVLPTILLSHIPEGLLAYGSINSWNVDIVFSGHTHGGQIRLPLIGGLFDSETGWFPKYSKGVFEKSGSTVIISAGLGSSERVPRFNNPPELVVVTIVPSEDYSS